MVFLGTRVSSAVMSPSIKWEPVELPRCNPDNLAGTWLTPGLNMTRGRSGLEGCLLDVCGNFWGTVGCQRWSPGHQAKHIAVEMSEGQAGSWPTGHRPHAAAGQAARWLIKSFYEKNPRLSVLCSHLFSSFCANTYGESKENCLHIHMCLI